jgi:hypothetical protein
MKFVQGFTWSIVPSVQVMLVDNINANGVNCSSLPSNVYMVEWREGRGEVETTTAPGLRTTFTDVSPYTVMFQNFMTIQEANGSLSLAQAQLIQNNLIACLYDDKRQAPYAYTPSGGTSQQWSAHDSVVAAMSLMVLGGTGGGATGINSLVSQINAMIDSINANSAQFNVMNSNLGYAMPLLRSTAQTILGTGSAVVPQAASPGTDGRGPGSGNFQTIAHIGGGTTANIPWSPIGATAPLNITMNDMTAIMSGIGTRRQTLLNTCNSKTAAVNALSTIAAVIAYSVTAGW